MKTHQSLISSQQSAIKKAHESAAALNDLLGKIHFFGQSDHRGDQMPKVRKLLAELNQRVHEYNAYSNALETK